MYNASSDIVFDNVFLTIKGLGIRCALKLDYFNAAGSIKMKTALGLVLSLEQQGLINRNTTLIESSSGNLGVALSMICAERKYRFVCVCDPNISQSNLKLMMALGTRIVQVDTKDSNGGYLGTRIAYVRQTIAADPNCLWLNQYSNPANPQTHARTTASSIFNSFTRVNYLFVGAGTTGTLMGCIDFFKKYSPYTKIVAVDSLGSVTFGGPAGKRHIPGLGSSQMPPLFRADDLYAMESIKEVDTIRMCRYMARENGLLFGGSTGTVLAGVMAWKDRIHPDATVVAISPDAGERYLDTIYNDDWVRARFPDYDFNRIRPDILASDKEYAHA
ncbi:MULTISPECIES: 2,3-diaminopropionate biosynthesis protein SbnA [Pseudomonas]|uniref:cysteine synthase n=1 Tax=Pseudomonas brassicacearum TaxID=930166 RepID=A0A423GBC7_9PSED|nr:2,3-diaminopropionate biosynthesis protein SbnA [Pseudomonas brassicacearum]BBP65620.1 hypothetical protein PHLH5_31610 [Pseudomonas sp. Cab53]